MGNIGTQTQPRLAEFCDGTSTLAEYLRHWLRVYCERRLADNTIRGYRTNVERHIIPYLGNVALNGLTPDMVDRLYETLLESGLSSATVIYVHATLRKALNTAMKRRIVRENVIECVDPPRRGRYVGAVLSSEEVCRLLNVCRYRDIYIPVLLAVVFGLRRGEVLGLRWDDVDFEQGLIRICRSASFNNDGFKLSECKTASSNRTLLMPVAVSDVLTWWRDVQSQPSAYNLVVSRYDGTMISPNVLQRRFKKALDDAKLCNIRFHDLRHTYATLMLRENVQTGIVSKILGHSSVKVTSDVYSHVLFDMQRPAADVIDAMMGKI